MTGQTNPPDEMGINGGVSIKEASTQEVRATAEVG